MDSVLNVCVVLAFAVIIALQWKLRWMHYFYLVWIRFAARCFPTTDDSCVDAVGCPNPSCVRCLNAVYENELLRKRLCLHAETASLSNDQVRRLLHSLDGPVGSARLNRSNSAVISKPTVFYLQGLPSSPFHDVDRFPDLAVFRERSVISKIKEEFLTELKHDSSWVKNGLDSSGGGWKLLYLMNQGEDVNRGKCMFTRRILEGIGLLMTGVVFGNAAFSILEPKTKLQVHCGSTNVRLRCHVTLTANKLCSLHVGGETRYWSEDNIMLFDDSLPHYAHNNCDAEKRAVLLFDIWHPGVSEAEQHTLKAMFMLP